MKEYTVDFFLSNGQEIGHLMKGRSMNDVKKRLTDEFASNESPFLDLDDMMIAKSHVQYFIIREYER